MKRSQLQNGFAIVEMIMIVVVLAIIAFAAWRVIEATGTVDDVANQTNNSSTPVESIPVVTKASDLDKLKAMLDAVDVDDDTTAQLVEQTTF
jgi:hypothetical protein